MTSATTVPDGAANPTVTLETKQDFVSLSQGLAGHRNSLGVIRLILASAVIFSHAFYIGGWGHDPFLDLVRGQESIGGLAVLGFFAISGYLITKSGAATDGLQFIWRRGLRILPAYWTVLIVTAGLVGPAIWLLMNRPLSSYFTLDSFGPVAYVVRNGDLTVRQYGIHDIFADTTPYGAVAGSVFNGSLWTLGYEWGSYLIIWVFVMFAVLRRARILVPLLTAFYFIAEVIHRAVPGGAGQVFPYFADHYRLSLPLIFLFGACLAVYSRKVPLDWRLGVLAAVVVLGTLRYGGFTILGYPAIAYFVLWLAAALPARLHWIGARNDYSYGMYVYGFLVQQVTAYFGWYQWGYWPWTLACVAVTGACAWLSWHGVEKWAMKLKDAGPGRGIQHWSARAQSAGSRLVPRRRAAEPTADDPAPND